MASEQQEKWNGSSNEMAAAMNVCRQRGRSNAMQSNSTRNLRRNTSQEGIMRAIAGKIIGVRSSNWILYRINCIIRLEKSSKTEEKTCCTPLARRRIGICRSRFQNCSLQTSLCLLKPILCLTMNEGPSGTTVHRPDRSCFLAETRICRWRQCTHY